MDNLGLCPPSQPVGGIRNLDAAVECFLTQSSVQPLQQSRDFIALSINQVTEPC
jgi:hypothetical protein